MEISDESYWAALEAAEDSGGVLGAQERLILTNAYQSMIRSYGWQSAAARLLAIFSVPLFLYVGSARLPFWQLAPPLCLVLLWLLDGYWQEMRLRYLMVVHDVVHSGRKPDLGIQTFETLNVGTLWQPVQAVIYIPLITLFVVIGLR